MAQDSSLFFDPRLTAMGLGYSSDPRQAYDPNAAAMGASQVTTNAADAALGLAPPPRSSPLLTGFQYGPASAAPPPPPPAPEAAPVRRGPADIFYSPSLGRYSVGGVEFGEEEFDVALQSPSFLSRPGSPQTPAPDWRRLRGDQYGRYLQSISEGRGLVGNIGVGLRQTGESLVGGVGRGLQMAGLEAPGEALVGLGEAIGLSPAEEARSAAIAERQGLMGKIGTATVQSAPTLATAIGAGLAGAAVGGPVGALAGVALSILPMELQSSWEAAEANPDLDVTDSGVQGEILAAALGKTAAQTFGAVWLARGLSPAFRQVLGDVAGKSLGSRITRGVGAGAVEGLAETTAVLVDRVAFDPELRALMTEGDWMAIAPAFAQKFGEEALIAFGAGFLLGAPLGAISSPPPQRNVDTDEPVDMLSGATLSPQAAPGTQGEFFPGMDLGQTPAEPIILAPEQRVGRQLELPFPEAAAPVETQLELPLQAPVGAQGDLFGAVPPIPAAAPQPAPLALPSPAMGGTVIPQAPLQLGPALLPVLPLTPQQRVDVPMPLLPQQRAEPGQGEMFTPAEAGVPVATQARLTGQRLAGAPRPETAAPPELTQAELEAAGQQRMELTTQPTAIASQLGPILEARRAEQNRLRQQAEEAAATRARREAEFEAAQRQAEQQREAERQQLIDADAAWEQLRPEGSRVTFDRLTPTAQQQWSEAVSDGTADQALFDDLRRRVRPGRAQPLKVDGGWGLRLRTPEDTPPTGGARGETPKRGPATTTRAPKGDTLKRGRQTRAVQEQGATEGAAQPVPITLEDGTVTDVVFYHTTAKGMVDVQKTPPRAIVVRRVNGVQVPFYLSTGDGGKAGVPSGKWYPFFGIGPMGWYNKGTDKQIVDYYGSPELRAVAATLDKQYGDIRNNPDAAPLVYADDGVTSAVNADTNPTSLADPEKLVKMAGVLKRIVGDANWPAVRARFLAGMEPDTTKRGARRAVQEPSPEAGAVREGLEAGPRVRGKDTKGQEAAGTREAQAQAPRIGGLSQAEREAAGRPSRAADLLIGRDRRQPAKRTQEQLEADRAREDIARAEAARRTETEAAARRAAEAEAETEVTATAAQAEQTKEAKAWAAAQEQNPDIDVDYADLTAEQKARWRRGRQTAESARRLWASLPQVEARAAAEAGQIIKYVQDLELEVVQRGFDGPKRDAAVELMRLRDDPTTPPNVKDDIVQILTNLTARQMSEVEALLDGGEVDANIITSLIETINAGGTLTETGRRYATEAWARVRGSNPEYNGRPLADYISGGPDFFNYGPRANGHRQIVPKGTGRTSRTTFNFTGGKFNNLDGSPVTRALPHGRAKMLISGFRKKLKRAPSIKTFTNVAQLKSKAPDLYARAAAARAQGDFDNVTAAGYSFGDGEVIIFTDNVANEAHLRFVLAHETMGHYGLRGFIPAADFDKTMESIYDEFPHIQGPVDAAMARVEGLSKAEAVEEYLSDYAALLETNLLLRVWNAVKNALNALGLKFVDDYPRYLINHARQYARRPGRGHFADMDVIAQRAHGVETGALAPGRYKRSDELFGTVEGMMSGARLLVGDRSIPKAAEKRVITDLPNTWESAKNEFLSLFPFQARKNPGLKALNEIITDGEQRTQHIRNLLDEEAAPALNNAIKVPGTDFEFGGMTEAETTLMNNALAVARVRAAQRLLDDPKANQSKTPIFTYDETTGTFTETVINPATGETEADRLADLYAITREEFDSEFTATIKRETGEREVRKYMRDPEVTNTDRAWDGYQRLRRAFVEAHKMLLLAKLGANTATMDGALEEIASLMPNNRLTSEQRRLIRKASQLYSDLYNKGVGVDTRTGQMQTDPDAIKQAEEFLQAFNTAIIADKPAAADTDLGDKNSAASRNKNLRDIIVKVASKQEADDIVASVENFKDAIRVEVTGKPGKFVSGLRKDQYLIQQKIASLNTAQFTANNGEQNFRYLVASQFTPIIQKGNYQVRIVPVTADGDPVALGDAYGGSVGYTQFATQSEADAFAEAFMAKQVDENGDPLMFEADTKGGAGETVKASIRLEARVDEVQADVLAPTRMGLQEFMMQIAHYSVPLTPEKRQEIMIDATRQDDRARKRLLTEFTPGDPKLGVEAIAKHIEGLASTVAKIEMRPRIERLMSRRNRRSQELWDGDPKRVEATKARYERLMADPGASREQVDAARLDYEEAQMLFDETGGMPNKFKNQAGKLLAFINDNETLTESNFDASAFISTWRTLTAVAQLGLNFVTAALNPVSVYTNVAPYLATRNSKTAFGGGFGMGRTMTEINRAFKQVGLPGTLPTKESAKFNEASFWEGVAADGALQKKYKVTDFEARMLAQEIRRGSMQPTLTNSLVNKSRGLASTAIGRKVADGMMFMFNVSEQASRRAAGLAAFRMEFARRVATIDPDLKGADYEAAVEQAYRESTKFVREMLDLTIGNYATSKRPNFFRGGWAGILYMYKVFPTTSIQLFRNMDAKGKMWMLAGLYMLGGIAAWPFAEEIEDLLDTLDQKFGLGVGTGSIRAWGAQQLDQIQPGLGKWVFGGVVGQLLPGDVASRVKLSAIPGTEFFLAGTDRARMYEEIAGPMPSALFGAGAAILDAVRAPFSTTITMEDVAREAPVTAIRLLADSYAYLNSGAIIDRRGYVVEPDLAWYDIATRIAGGYPISAAEEYGAIRIINRVANYRRELSAQYRSEWVQASIRGDVARRREVEDAVREWNRTHRGTPLEITNFRQGAQRALREARRPATERTLRTTPTAGRSEFEDIIDALTR